MEEKSVKQRMDEFVVKCSMLGLHKFDFEYNEMSDEVHITRIYSEDDEEVIVPRFVSCIDFGAWYENDTMRNCKIIIPKGCLVEFDECDMKPKYDSFADHVREIEVEKGHKEYTSKDGVLFNRDKSVLLVYPRYKQSITYTVPSSVIKIADNAFSCNEKLEKLNLSKNVVEIGTCCFTTDTKIDVNGGNTSYKSVKHSLYSKNGKILYSLYAPQGSSIKIEEGTVLLGNIMVEGYYDKLYLPNTVNFVGEIPFILDEHIVFYEIIKAPARLRKYTKKWEKLTEVIYY